MTRYPHRSAIALSLALLAVPRGAAAEVDVRALYGAARLSAGPAPAFRVLGRTELPAIVEVPAGEDPSAFGLPRIGARFSSVRAPLEELDALARAHPTWHVTWSAPLHPLMDRAATWVAAPAFRNETGFTGKGVFVGIVDTGVDVTHPDLRNDDGSTRIAYLIDYGSKPVGLHPDLEAACSRLTKIGSSAKGLPCSVYSGADIDDLLAKGREDELSHDTVGHGTHVASLAAGNGGRGGPYVGIAPEASLIVARVIDASNDIGDDAVIGATQMVFSLAEQEGKKQNLPRSPAVVNLSLGSDFGPHDGTSSLERALADLVGPEKPGRAIVVAAGNSAGLLASSAGFPSPLGIHTEVHVAGSASVLVPLATDAAGAQKGATLNAAMFVWVAFRPGDDLRVGVDRSSGSWLPPQPMGAAVQVGDAKTLSAAVVNGPISKIAGLNTGDANAAAVIIQGTWPATETFSIRLEGSGTANLWVQSEGDLGPQASSIGALFPAATKESTVTLPATHEALIAVGATLSRRDWTDRVGDVVKIRSFGSVADPPLDSVAYFSSAGPTTDLRMKPDLLAPGAFIAGAMSRDADPRRDPTSMFAESPCSPRTDCSVVDSGHAIASGTSMASPIVAGAVALLFQRDPSLTQGQVLNLLRAGAHFPGGRVPLGAQVGAGELDLMGSLDVARAQEAPVVREPASHTSWMTLAQAYAHPDPTWPVAALLQLRDESGKVADGFAPSQLTVSATNGMVTHDVERVAPGLFRFAVAAADGTGGENLDVTVRYRGRELVSESVPIAVDVNVARAGFTAHGGCALTGERRERSSLGEAAALVLVVTAWRGRRCSRAARTARNPDRTGSSGRARRGWFRR